jgi:hypothetical protein
VKRIKKETSLKAPVRRFFCTSAFYKTINSQQDYRASDSHDEALEIEPRNISKAKLGPNKSPEESPRNANAYCDNESPRIFTRHKQFRDRAGDKAHQYPR